jgi:hypothetical protein
VQWIVVDPASDGYPWDLAVLHPRNFPTPGMFIDLDQPDWFHPDAGFDELVRAALGSALAMAGSDPELASSRTSQGRRLRQEMRCTLFSRWHRALYGCANENYCCGVHPAKPGGKGRRAVVDHMMGPGGRGLSWVPRHAPNRDLLGAGRPARRTIDARGESLLGSPGFSRPLLWVPAVDLDALARENPQVTTLTWRDGVSTSEPPKVVRDLGVQDPYALPGMPSLVDTDGS